jgi:hypothetical protein
LIPVARRDLKFGHELIGDDGRGDPVEEAVEVDSRGPQSSTARIMDHPEPDTQQSAEILTDC